MTYSLTINGHPVVPAATFDVINPATGEVLAACPLLHGEEESDTG